MCRRAPARVISRAGNPQSAAQPLRNGAPRQSREQARVQGASGVLNCPTTHFFRRTNPCPVPPCPGPPRAASVHSRSLVLPAVSAVAARPRIPGLSPPKLPVSRRNALTVALESPVTPRCVRRLSSLLRQKCWFGVHPQALREYADSRTLRHARSARYRPRPQRSTMYPAPGQWSALGPVAESLSARISPITVQVMSPWCPCLRILDAARWDFPEGVSDFRPIKPTSGSSGVWSYATFSASRAIVPTHILTLYVLWAGQGRTMLLCTLLFRHPPGCRRIALPLSLR